MYINDKVESTSMVFPIFTCLAYSLIKGEPRPSVPLKESQSASRPILHLSSWEGWVSTATAQESYFSRSEIILAGA